MKLMIMNKKLFLNLILTLFLLNGCAPIVLFGGAAGSGVVLSKEKSVGNSVDDVTIWSKIKAEFVKNKKEIPGILTNVSVEVSEGRVLLTGTLDSPDDRLKVLRIVWDQNGVREVINEIKIADGGKTGIKQYTNDTWLTTQVKTKMLGDKEIHSLNYSVETIDNVVYILGVAKDENELQHVIDAAESVKGVEKVNAFVRVSSKKKQIEEADDSGNVAKVEKTHEHQDNNQKSNHQVEKIVPAGESDKVKYISPIEEEEVITFDSDE